MKIALFYGAGLFITLIVFHVIVWRFIKPKGEIIPIVSLFILFPLSIIIAQYLFYPLQLSKDEIWLGWILYFTLAGCYIQTYPAVTTEIPSLKIMLLLHVRGQLSEREIISAFTRHEMFQSRLDLLRQDCLIHTDSSTSRLSRAGRIIAKIFIAYRTFIGAEIGKG